MKRIFIVINLLIILGLACSLGSQTGGDNLPPKEAESPLSESESPNPQSEKRCGDNICDGPENNQNCPEDCQTITAGSDESVPEESQPRDSEKPNSGFRYVSFSGAISTALNTDTMGDFSGTAFEYSGEYKVELWFPMQGGDAVQQRNYITFTQLHDLYFGDTTCTPCEWALDENSFEPVEFQLEASLNLGGIQEDGQPADELAYQLTELPQATISGVVSCPCPGAVPDDYADPGAHLQMLTWFMHGITNPIHLNSVESNTVEMFPISPMGYINIPKETLSYTTVPDLDTP